MSFIQNLVSKRRAITTPQVQSVPISLPAAYDGLAGTIREPHRVSAPLDNQFSPTSNLPVTRTGTTFRG